MKKIILVLSIITILFTISATKVSIAADPKIFRVAAFDNYPVIFKDTDGVFKGFYVDLLSEIAKNENIQFEYVFGTWTEGLDRIKTGEVDLLTSVGYTAERSVYLDYPQSKILNVWGEVYTSKSSTIDNILEISGKNIGVLKDDINAINFQERINKFEVSCNYTEYSSYDEIFAAMANNEVDAVVVGVTFGSANMEKYGLKSTGIVFNPIYLYFTTAKGKNQNLLGVIDIYLNKWNSQKDSFLYQSKQKWMPGLFETKEVTPLWIKFTLISSGILLIFSIIFVILLKIQVKQKTKKIIDEIEKNKKVEQNLWQYLFVNSQDALMTVEPTTQKFTTGNEATIKLFNAKNQEDFISHSLDDLSPEKQPDGRLSSEKAKEMIEKALINGSNYFEWTHKKLTGEIFPVTVLLTTINFRDKKILQATIRDISAQKKLEEEALKYKEALELKVKELEKFSKLTIDRELKMVELKEKLLESEKK